MFFWFQIVAFSCKNLIYLFSFAMVYHMVRWKVLLEKDFLLRSLGIDLKCLPTPAGGLIEWALQRSCLSLPVSKLIEGSKISFIWILKALFYTAMLRPNFNIGSSVHYGSQDLFYTFPSLNHNNLNLESTMIEPSIFPKPD